jgi:hypothetical protein
MRWQPERPLVSERTQLILLSPVIAVACIALLPLLVLGYADFLIRGAGKWGRWFAWHPVTTGDWLHNNEQKVWLEWVERRRWAVLHDWHYRIASAGEAGTAETAKTGSVHEHAVRDSGDAQPPAASVDGERKRPERRVA